MAVLSQKTGQMLLPLAENELMIISVPTELMDILKFCTIVLSFNDDYMF